MKNLEDKAQEELVLLVKDLLTKLEKAEETIAKLRESEYILAVDLLDPDEGYDFMGDLG